MTLRTAEAAALLRVGRHRLYGLMREGHLIEGVHYFRPPGMQLRFDESALRAFLAGENLPLVVPSSQVVFGAAWETGKTG